MGRTKTILVGVSTVIASLLTVAGPLSAQASAASHSRSPIACNQNDVTTIVLVSQDVNVLATGQAATSQSSSLTVEARNGVGQSCVGVSIDYGDSADGDATTNTSEAGTGTVTPGNAQGAITNGSGQVTFVRNARAAATITWRVWADLNPNNNAYDLGEATLTGSYDSYTQDKFSGTISITSALSRQESTATRAQLGLGASSLAFSVHVNDQHGQNFVSAPVEGSFDNGCWGSGPNCGLNTAPGTLTDASGNATMSLTDASATRGNNVDALTACIDTNADGVCDSFWGGEPQSNTQNVNWEFPVVDLTPEGNVDQTGTSQVFSATVLDQDGNTVLIPDGTPGGSSVRNFAVDFQTITGPNNTVAANNGVRVDQSAVTDNSGVTVPTFTLNDAEAANNTTDKVCAWWDYNATSVYNSGGANSDGGSCFGLAVGTEGSATTADTANVSWQDPVASLLNLTPSSASKIVGDGQTMSATVTDQFGGTMAGELVNFTVTGPNATVGSALTNASGVATFHYVGTAAGSDTVTAVDGSASDSSSISWTKASTSLSIHSAPHQPFVPSGTQVQVYGTLSSGYSACASGQRVILFVNGHKAAVDSTNSRGHYSFAMKVTRTVTTQTKYLGSSACGASTSRKHTIRVK